MAKPWERAHNHMLCYIRKGENQCSPIIAFLFNHWVGVFLNFLRGPHMLSISNFLLGGVGWGGDKNFWVLIVGYT